MSAEPKNEALIFHELLSLNFFASADSKIIATQFKHKIVKIKLFFGVFVTEN